MQLRDASINDADSIKAVDIMAFDESEAMLVSELSVSLLGENQPLKTLSLVALKDDATVGHIAFSPVCLKETGDHIGYILAPLAVSPAYQKKGIGSSLVKAGLDKLSRQGRYIVFVYGDPAYYSRFGFKEDIACNFFPPHKLELPQGWLALNLNSPSLPSGGEITCVDSLDRKTLW